MSSAISGSAAVRNTLIGDGGILEQRANMRMLQSGCGVAHASIVGKQWSHAPDAPGLDHIRSAFQTYRNAADSRGVEC